MTSMHQSCVAEPISMLRLERYRLHELSSREASAVSAHLEQCGACRACLAEIDQDDALAALPELRPERPATAVAELIELRSAARRVRTRRLMSFGAGISGALAMAAAALLVLRPAVERQSADVPPARFGIKGGDVAVELVRKHQGALADDAAVFADGDVFKVLVTCPPPLAPHFDVVVYQDGRAYFPLSSGTLESCGNRRALSGAFTLDGAEAVVCVALDAQRLPSRSALGRGAGSLPELSVCTRVRPR